MKRLLRLLFILVILGLSFLYIIKNPQLQISKNILTTLGLEKLLTGDTATIANPASVYCEQNSGTLEIIIDLSGGQSGICHLPDGTTCDEWVYFRGECPSTGSVEVTGDNLSGDNQRDVLTTTDKYIVREKENKTSPFGGYDIYVYDKEGNIIFSLLQSDNDTQYLHEITGDYLVVEYGSDPVIMGMTIYDLRSQQEIFHSEYSLQHEEKLDGLYIEGNKVYFAMLVFNPNNSTQREITKPNKLPTCSQGDAYTGLTVGYSEIRAFNLDTKQLEKTGKLVCTFLQ